MQRNGLLLASASLMLAACFDPSNPTGSGSTGESETEGPDDATTPTSGPSTSVSDTTPTTSVSDTTPPTTEPTTDETLSTGAVECEMDEDCSELAGECEVAVCDGNVCGVLPARADTACGDDTDNECTAPDTCDGTGTCQANDIADGTTCTECDSGACTCSAGACGDCQYAPVNNFITTRSIEGWELTGGWGLYRSAPQNLNEAAQLFPDQVFGTDGNRSAPYPGQEDEDSYARTTPTVIPETIEFLSWHVDEGGDDYDTKSIAISVDDGDTWTIVADCFIDNSPPFCPPIGARAADDWDEVSIAVPEDLQGEIGLIELRYDTGDDLVGFERGWFIDAANFGVECGCVSDAQCETLGGECGAGVCGSTGECELDAEDAGTACGDDTDSMCNDPDACDGVGYCLENNLSTGLDTCFDCPAGAGSCQLWCQEGACNDCTSFPAVNDFETDLALVGWSFDSIVVDGPNDWRLYFQAPPNTLAGSVAVPFPTLVFGTDGNRVSPYDTAVDPFNQHAENSRATTWHAVVPEAVTFQSWHVDEGSGDGGYDNKIIEISVDDGENWDVLVDCLTPEGQANFAFCPPVADGRLGTAWDSISIDTSAYEGEVGQLRFTYASGDDATGFERGWYIDDLAFGTYCTDPQFPIP